MSDTRFIMLGAALIFAGFVILGVLGSGYTGSTIEEIEFGDCYEYYDDKPPVQVSCDQALLDKLPLLYACNGPCRSRNSISNQGS